VRPLVSSVMWVVTRAASVRPSAFSATLVLFRPPPARAPALDALRVRSKTCRVLPSATRAMLACLLRCLARKVVMHALLVRTAMGPERVCALPAVSVPTALPFSKPPARLVLPARLRLFKANRSATLVLLATSLLCMAPVFAVLAGRVLLSRLAMLPVAPIALLVSFLRPTVRRRAVPVFQARLAPALARASAMIVTLVPLTLSMVDLSAALALRANSPSSAVFPLAPLASLASSLRSRAPPLAPLVLQAGSRDHPAPVNARFVQLALRRRTTH